MQWPGNLEHSLSFGVAADLPHPVRWTTSARRRCGAEPRTSVPRPNEVRPFIGTEAVIAGTLNRYQLATRFQQVHRNVYAPKGIQLNAVDKAQAAWLWSGRRATVAGLSAAALHGSHWIDPGLPA